MTIIIPLVCFLVGVVLGVINNEFRSSGFWFWCALILAIIIGPAAHLVIQ